MKFVYPWMLVLVAVVPVAVMPAAVVLAAASAAENPNTNRELST